MKTIIAISLALLLTACSTYDGYAGGPPPPSPDSTRIYDKDGNLVGHIDERNNRIYDRNGNLIGRIQR